VSETSDIDILDEIATRMAAADSLPAVLDRVVQVVSAAVPCDACCVHVLAGEELVLQASSTPETDAPNRPRPPAPHRTASWLAEHRQPLVIGREAFLDDRVTALAAGPDGPCEACLCVPLLARGRFVGFIGLMHRQPYVHSRREVQLVSAMGVLASAEIEMARLERENAHLQEQLEARKVIDRAEGILQRDLGLTEEDAYLTIQRQSRQRRKSRREIAEAIILGDELRRDRGGA